MPTDLVTYGEFDFTEVSRVCAGSGPKVPSIREMWVGSERNKDRVSGVERHDGESYDVRYQRYVQRCKDHNPPIKPKPKGTYSLIPVDKERPAVIRMLNAWERKGKVRTSPVGPHFANLVGGQAALVYTWGKPPRGNLFEYATNHRELPEFGKLQCYQGIMVFATGVTLRAMGIPEFPVGDKYGLSFAKVNEMYEMASSYDVEVPHFELLRPHVDIDTLVKVFKQPRGIFLFHTQYFHWEDWDCPYGEPILHYGVLNAGTQAPLPLPTPLSYRVHVTVATPPHPPDEAAPPTGPELGHPRVGGEVGVLGPAVRIVGAPARSETHNPRCQDNRWYGQPTTHHVLPQSSPYGTQGPEPAPVSQELACSSCIPRWWYSSKRTTTTTSRSYSRGSASPHIRLAFQ